MSIKTVSSLSLSNRMPPDLFAFSTDNTNRYRRLSRQATAGPKIKSSCPAVYRLHGPICRTHTGHRNFNSTVKADSHIACRAHAVLLPCRAAKGLEFFPIWLTQCGLVWFTLAMPCPFRTHAMLWPCRGLEKNGMVRAWHGRCMGMTWKVWIRRGRTKKIKWERHSKPLAARHGWGTAWARHTMCESAFILPIQTYEIIQMRHIYIYICHCYSYISFFLITKIKHLNKFSAMGRIFPIFRTSEYRRASLNH